MKNIFLKFPMVFDEVLLGQDLELCLAHNWSLHYNTKDYNGLWTSISLRSATGKESDVYSNPGVLNYFDTALLGACTYFTKVINSFDCEKESIRILLLAAGSQVKEHTDNDAGYADGFFRIHIPVKTNSKVSFVVGGKNLRMQAGECWYADFNLPHSIKNEGDTDRVHLVIDCIRNAWSDALFKAAGYDFENEHQEKTYDTETKQKMIAELSKINTPAAQQLVAQLKKELEQGT